MHICLNKPRKANPCRHVEEIIYPSYSLVVVCREEAEIVGQTEDVVLDGFIQHSRVALLEICASTAADQKGVPGEGNSLRRERGNSDNIKTIRIGTSR